MRGLAVVAWRVDFVDLRFFAEHEAAGNCVLRFGGISFLYGENMYRYSRNTKDEVSVE